MAFNNEGIRVWRAYGVGPGKLKLWENLNVSNDYILQTLNNPHEVSSHTAPVSFVNIATRRQSKNITVPDKLGSAEEDVINEDLLNAKSLFFCPEEGCIKSFQQHSSLENHLDCEKHKYALEQETLYDKAIMMYASKLEHGPTSEAPQISEGVTVHVVDTPVLKMGWALKSTKEYKQLSEKQKKYLVDCYDIGEDTGQKADPVSISRTMRKARLSSGEPMFCCRSYSKYHDVVYL
jgi:hypothetical protein